MMIAFAIAFVGGAGTCIHPRVRRTCKRCGRAFLKSAAYVGYLYMPATAIDWEDVRYQRWLESHERVHG